MNKEGKTYSILFEYTQKFEILVDKIDQFIINEENRKLLQFLGNRITVKGFKALEINRYIIYSCEEMVQTKPKKKPKLREIYVFNDIIVHLFKNSNTNNPDAILDPKICKLSSKIENSSQTISLSYPNWTKIKMFEITTNNLKKYNTLYNCLEKVIKKNRKNYYERESSGFFKLDKKDIQVFKQNVSILDTQNTLKYCCLVEKELWSIRDNSSISILNTSNKTFKTIFSDPNSVFNTICYDGRDVFLTKENGEILVFDNKTHKIECQSPQFHSSKINSLHFLQKENFFVSSDESGVLCFWKFEENAFHLLKKLEIGGNLSLIYPFVERDCTNILVSSFDNEDKKSNLFKIEDPSNIETLEPIKVGSIDGMISSLCYGNGNIWVAVEQDIVIHDLFSFFQISLIKKPHKRTKVSKIIFMNGIVLSVGQDSTIKIFDPSNCQLLKILEDHNDQIIQAIIKSNGRFFSISKSGEIYKWKFDF